MMNLYIEKKSENENRIAICKVIDSDVATENAIRLQSKDGQNRRNRIRRKAYAL